MLYGDVLPIAGQANSRDFEPLTKKRELFPGPPQASPGSFALPHWTPRKEADLRVRVREY